MASLGSKLPIMIKAGTHTEPPHLMQHVDVVSALRLLVQQNSAVENSKPKLATFLKYARVELAPPKVSEIPQVMAGFGKLVRGAKTGAWKNVTVREGWLNTLVALDVIFFFYIGECIGKRSLIGYQV